MRRSYLLIAISAIALLACTNDQSLPLGPPIGISNPIPVPVPAVVELTGIVELDGKDEAGVQLRLSDGLLVRLLGPEAPSLARVPGAEVWVRGTWETSVLGDRREAGILLIGGFMVERFQVNAVGGRAASDGVVEETSDGYALRLQDGTLRELLNAPAELIDLVGSRIWITGIDEPPVAFGVIEQ